MKAKTAVIGIAAAAITIPVMKKLWGSYLSRRDNDMRQSAKTMERSAYVDVVEETLQAHSGEDTPFVHAFEEALEMETRLEEQLAKDTGLRTAR